MEPRDEIRHKVIGAKREHSKLLAEYQLLSARLFAAGGDRELGDLLGEIDRQRTVAREILFGSSANPFPTPSDLEVARAMQALRVGNECVRRAQARAAAITAERNRDEQLKRDARIRDEASAWDPRALIAAIEKDGRFKLGIDGFGALTCTPLGLDEGLRRALLHHLSRVKAQIEARSTHDIIG